MKKSILIGVLAALMLFAFVACEQQIPTYKVPTGLSISTAKTNYIVGETLDTSAFTGTVRYSNGSSDTLTDSELSLSVPAQDGKIVANANKVTATYGAGENAVEATAVVYGNYVSAAVIGNLPTTVAQSVSGGDDEQPIPAAGTTVTVTYAGMTRELVAGEYELTLTADTQTPTTAGGTGVKVDAVLSVFGNRVAATKITTGNVVVTAYVAEPYEMTGAAKHINVSNATTMPAKIFYGQNTSEFTDNIIVRVTDKESAPSTWDDTNSVVVTDYSIAWGTGVTNGAFTVAGTDITAAQDVSYTISYGSTGLRSTGTVKVWNYVKGLQLSEGAELKDAVIGNVIPTTGITVNGVLAYDSNPADEKEAVTAAALSGWFYVNPYYTGSPSETIRFFNELGNPVETSIKVTYAAE